MKPTILLLGKNGQLGFELLRLLPQLGHVVAPERRELDLFNAAQILQFVGDVRPRLIVNAAAHTAVDAAQNDESTARAVNAEAPALLANEAKKISAALVHFSTDYVFDGTKTAPYVESDPVNPLSVYGQTKLAGESAIRESGVSHLIFRTSWVYGTRGRNFLLTILRLATEREELSVVSDQRGAPTRAVAIAEATADVLKVILTAFDVPAAFAQLGGTYHMTAAGSTTWFGFASAILDYAAAAGSAQLPWLVEALHGRTLMLKRLIPVSSQAYGSVTMRPAFSVLSNRRLLETFNIQLPDWRTQLQRCFSLESQNHFSSAAF